MASIATNSVQGTSMREEFGLPAGVTLGLFAGDIRSPRKNLDAVLRSLVHVPEVHLAVAGGIQGSPYPAISRDLGVSDRVHFLGMVSRMPDLMRSCDLFLFPSRYEACSLVMLEAMASGLPVVTPATTGGAELVPSDGGFHLSSPEDLDGMVQFLKRTQDAPGILAEMSVRAREAAESLSWNVMADRYLDLLEGIPSAQLRPASAS
jgi:glycosyltransferase involved in cell wall biosynthesis